MPKFSLISKCLLQVAPCCCLLATTAQATPNDSIQFSAGLNINTDSNIFRLSPSANIPATLGRDSADETIRTATGSIAFTKDYGLQHVDLSASAARYDYQNFSYLGFTAFNYSGGLRWSLTPRIRGNVLATRRESQINFGDFQNVGVQSKRTETNTRGDAIYELDGAWQLVAGASNLDIKNTAPVVAQRSYEMNSVDAGIRRTWGSRSQATWRLRRSSGKYSGGTNFANNSLPSGFDETENEWTLSWVVTPKSTLETRLSYIQRRYDEYAARDYSGVVSRTNLQWGISAQTSVLVAYMHELTDYQTAYSSYIRSNRLVVIPSWQATPKLILTFRQEFSDRQFEGTLPGTTVSPLRKDRQQLSKLSATWKPRDSEDISVWAQTEKRRSNYSGFDFTSHGVGVSLQINF